MVSYFDPTSLYRQQENAMQQSQFVASGHQFPEHHPETQSQQQCNWYDPNKIHPASAAATVTQQYLQEQASNVLSWSACRYAPPLQLPNHTPFHSSFSHQNQIPRPQIQDFPRPSPSLQMQSYEDTIRNKLVPENNSWIQDDGNKSSTSEQDSGVSSSSPTTFGSEMSSPGTPGSSGGEECVTNKADTSRQANNRSPFAWMKKNQLSGICNDRTRTKDKYRGVYSEHQKLELEKEFYSSKYITMNRKAELSQTLELSERQIKIWFQNRRAKERKFLRKRKVIDGIEEKSLLNDDNQPPVTSMTNFTPTAGIGFAGFHNLLNWSAAR